MPKNWHYLCLLDCAGNELAFIIACVLSRFTLSYTQACVTGLSLHLKSLLEASPVPASPAASTDSDDSAGSDAIGEPAHAFMKVRARQQRRVSSPYQRQRSARDRLDAGLKTAQNNPEFHAALTLLLSQTTRPFLLLSSHLSLSSFRERYVSYRVDNLHLLGCDMTSAKALLADANFRALKSIPQLDLPNAGWKISETFGAGRVHTALWLREEMNEILLRIPQLIQEKLALSTPPPLVFSATCWQTDKRGRIVPNSSFVISANDNVKVAAAVPFTRPLPAMYQARPVPAALSAAPLTGRRLPPPPMPGTWAERVFRAAMAQRRPASNPSVNHHPRKEQRVGSSAAPPSGTVALDQPLASTVAQQRAASATSVPLPLRPLPLRRLLTLRHMAKLPKAALSLRIPLSPPPQLYRLMWRHLCDH